MLFIDRLHVLDQRAHSHIQLYLFVHLLRREMHNELQDLKGNIRVFVRVKPLPSDPNQSTSPKYRNAQEVFLKTIFIC